MKIHSTRLLIIGTMLVFAVTTVKSQTSDESTEVKSYEKNLPRPEWVSEYPVVFVGNWDNIPMFDIRRGGGLAENNYYKDYTEESVKKLKDMGVTLAIIPFYKGFGLEAEKENIQYSKKLALLFKQQGLKIGVYIGSTLGYETFLVENPNAEKWIVPDYLGKPVAYGNQTFRKRVYFQHPEYKTYIKRVLKMAIEDLKVDLIHFDNTSLQAQPAIFHHPMAIEDFRMYLTKKYSPEILKKRLGFSDMRFVEPPAYDKPLQTINDPLAQEWTDFRCKQLSDYYGEMEEYIHKLNPEVAIDNNPHSGLSGHNTIWDQGVDYPELLAHTDFIWTEEGNEATYTNDQILISKIRTYKLASTLNNRIFTYTSNSRLLMAEALAYNRQGIGMVGDLSSYNTLQEDQKNYIEFFHKNFEYYKDIENIADVAVLHSYPTMAFNNDLPYQSTYLFEQVLIQAKILFDIIFDSQLKDLSKYKVLVLADQECLDDDQLDLIRKYIEQGGNLVATENTSLYTSSRLRKERFGLEDIFGKNVAIDSGKNSLVIQNKVGKGRVVYISNVQPSINKPEAVAMTSKYWKLPVNYEKLIKSVKWASNDNLSFNVNAPLSVTAELTEKKNKSSLFIHLVNYDFKNSLVRNIKVDIQIPEGKKVTQIIVQTPDGGKSDNLQFKENDGKVMFIVPQLEVYDIVVLKLE